MNHRESPKDKQWQHLKVLSTLGSATDQEPDDLTNSDIAWLNTKEAARYLRKSANALRIMVVRGYVRPRKLRNRLYFRKIELDRLLESSAF